MSTSKNQGASSGTATNEASRAGFAWQPLNAEQAENTTPVTHVLQPRGGRRSSNAARFAAIRPYIENRRVLDLGSARGVGHEDWFHGLVHGVASEAVAMDIDADGIAEVQSHGLPAFVGDASDFDIGSRFDVVVAGELIEHLVDLQGFFDSVRRHLEPGGRLILTTPNPFALTNFMYRLGSKPAPINPDHTCWFCEDTLKTCLGKAGYSLESLGYLRHETPGRARGLIAKMVRGPLPDRLAWRTIIAVAVPV